MWLGPNIIICQNDDDVFMFESNVHAEKISLHETFEFVTKMKSVLYFFLWNILHSVCGDYTRAHYNERTQTYSLMLSFSCKSFIACSL